jgi:hypothetical protein
MMRVRDKVGLSFIPLLLSGVGIVIASSGGPPASRTGAPACGTKTAETTCRGCHSDFAIDSGATLQLVNAPNFYVAGVTYTFSVRIASTQTVGNAGRVWSFELTAVNMADGNGAGTFANVVGQGTQIKSGSGQYSTRRYIQSTTDAVGATTPVEWQVQWTAPDPGVGSVGFFATGVAGNGTGSNKGDWVVSTSSVMQDVTATEAISWGKVKAIYR